jgi:hypothetical protein
MIDEPDPKHTYPVSGSFIIAVINLKEAAALVVKTEGAYDLNHLAECIRELEEA